MEANVALHRKQAEKAKAHAQKALHLIPDDLNPVFKGLLRGAANFRLVLAHQELGQYEPACDLLLDVLEGLKAGKNYVGVSKTLFQIVTIYQELGKIRAAILLCEDTLQFMSEHGWEKSPSCGIVNLILADLQAISSDFDAAKKNLDIGRKLVEPIKNPKIINMMKDIDEKLGNTTSTSQSLVEPLSPRELEILQLIAQGFSNREISEQLFLALSTVKGHNSNIFDKLQVQRRTEAVARARELGLV
jgi:ATP/maltotriose-dependent transcriptional regulator MalT